MSGFGVLRANVATVVVTAVVCPFVVDIVDAAAAVAVAVAA